MNNSPLVRHIFVKNEAITWQTSKNLENEMVCHFLCLSIRPPIVWLQVRSLARLLALSLSLSLFLALLLYLIRLNLVAGDVA